MDVPHNPPSIREVERPIFGIWPSIDIKKTDNMDATTMNNVDSAKSLPGQIRFPYPNADINVGSSRTVPSRSRNRSGLKTSGSGYLAGLRKIALEELKLRLKSTERTAHHEFGTTIAPSKTSIK